MEKNAKRESCNKKWFFGKFFGKKREPEVYSSSDEGCARLTEKSSKKNKGKRNNRVREVEFDRNGLQQQNDNEIFLPISQIKTPDQYRSVGSPERRAARRERKRLVKLVNSHSPSDDDDDDGGDLMHPTPVLKHQNYNNNNNNNNNNYNNNNIENGNNSNKKTRSSRTERYYKRLTRDGTVPIRDAVQRLGRWIKHPHELNTPTSQKPQPPTRNSLKTTSSLNSIPVHSIQPMNWNYYPQNDEKHNMFNPVNIDKRSFSYENNTQFPYRYPIEIIEPHQPVIPIHDIPRRRLHASVKDELRPMSYATNKYLSPIPVVHDRCSSDGNLFDPNVSIFHNTAKPRPASAQLVPTSRRFITRSQRYAPEQIPNLNAAPDYKYMTDSLPRSRKPIHILKSEDIRKPIAITPQTSAFVPYEPVRTTRSGILMPPQSSVPPPPPKRFVDQEQVLRRGRNIENVRPKVPSRRSVSSSGVYEHRNSRPLFYHMGSGIEDKNADETDHIVNASLLIKPTKDNKAKNFIEINSKPEERKSITMPGYFHYRQPLVENQMQKNYATLQPRSGDYKNYRGNEYSKTQPINIEKYFPNNIRNRERTPPMKKSTSLEEAIIELEEIYSSLNLNKDDDVLDGAERRSIPTSTNFAKYAANLDVDDDEDEDNNKAQPDVILDDVVYRKLKQANSKPVEPQPLFGIPIISVPSSPNTDYLHVMPETKENKRDYVPDIVYDDLAVRALRKDSPSFIKSNIGYSTGSLKKPKDIKAFSPIEKTGSLICMTKDEPLPPKFSSMKTFHSENYKTKPTNLSHFTKQFRGIHDDIPSGENNCRLITSQHSAFQVPPVPLPRRSLSPKSVQNRIGMEEALNQIAKDAKESSEKLNRELIELRKNSYAFPENCGNCGAVGNKKEPNLAVNKLNSDIEEVSKSARICGELIMDIVPPEEEPVLVVIKPKPRKLEEEKLLRDIAQVSEAAKACKKIFEEKVNDTELSSDSNKKSLQCDSKEPQKKEDSFIVVSLVEKIDPSSEEIGRIAARCMRQISELSDLQDEALVPDDNNDANKDGGHDQQNNTPVSEYDIPTTVIGIEICKQNETKDHDNTNNQKDSVVPGQTILATYNAEEEEEEVGKDEEDDDDDGQIGSENMTDSEFNQSSRKSPTAPLLIIIEDDKTSADEFGFNEPEPEPLSSDCCKSSSPTSPAAHQYQRSSSLTSIHSFSSSDYVKTPLSDCNAPSTDSNKTFKTSSCDVESANVTPIITNSPISTTPSSFALTPIDHDMYSRSPENSSDEIAIIFGYNPSDTSSPVTAGFATDRERISLNTAKNFGQPQEPKDIQIEASNQVYNENCENRNIIPCQLTHNNNPKKYYESSTVLQYKNRSKDNQSKADQSGKKRFVAVRSESRPISTLYDIICKEIESNMNSLDGAVAGGTSDDVKTQTTANESTKSAINFKQKDEINHKNATVESPGLAKMPMNSLLTSFPPPKVNFQLARPFNNSNVSSNVRNDAGLVKRGSSVPCVDLKSKEAQVQLDFDASNDKNGTNSEDNDNKDNLVKTGRRYITRSNRSTPFNTDSSSSPSHALKPRSSRLISPIKSPSKRSTQPIVSSVLSPLNVMTSDSSSPINAVVLQNYGAVSCPSLINSSSPLSPLCQTQNQQLYQPLSINNLSDKNLNKNGFPPPAAVLQNKNMAPHNMPPQPVRTTKASRLRAAALEKKNKTEETLYAVKSKRPEKENPSNRIKSNRERTTTVPAYRMRNRLDDSKRSTSVGATTSAIIQNTNKKLIPSISVSMNQILNETSFDGLKKLSIGATSSSAAEDSSSVVCTTTDTTAECTLKLANMKHLIEENSGNSPDLIDLRETPRIKTSNFNLNTSTTSDISSVSPVRFKASGSPRECRDKSAKRKSNLNRALNEESFVDDNIELRRRYPREPEMGRQLASMEETTSALRDVVSFLDQRQKSNNKCQLPISPRMDSSYLLPHPRGDTSWSARLRASTDSPKLESDVKKDIINLRKMPEKSDSVPSIRTSNNEYNNVRKSMRMCEVSRKVDAIRERTKCELAEIKKITAKCNKVAPSPSDKPSVSPSIDNQGFTTRITDNLKNNENIFNNNSTTGKIPNEEILPQSQNEMEDKGSGINLNNHDKDFNRENKKFIKADKISFQDDIECSRKLSPHSLPFLLENKQSSLDRKVSKAHSHDDEICPESSSSSKISPILRRKSAEDQTTTSTINNIVSILKKKDAESSSASSNASPVTFSSSVFDTPTRSSKRAGILKKRSSLDESRYNRSHSPDDKSILIRSVRRNSLEETQHGILKQRSYESNKNDGYVLNEPHGILKKKDSISTPSDNQPKHVSISHAVILAAAELCQDFAVSENEFDIKPILKQDSQEIHTPKPILKKKFSSETEEIRPILKTSRKSSREESDIDESFRPILKTDSPAKRRSIVDQFDANIVVQRSRSLETPERVMGTHVSIENRTEIKPDEMPETSVADRIKTMEQIVVGRSSGGGDTQSSGGAISKASVGSGARRYINRHRFNTQPVTAEEISLVLPARDLINPGSPKTLTSSTKFGSHSISSISPPLRFMADHHQSPNILSNQLNNLCLSGFDAEQRRKMAEFGNSINSHSEYKNNILMKSGSCDKNGDMDKKSGEYSDKSISNNLDDQKKNIDGTQLLQRREDDVRSTYEPATRTRKSSGLFAVQPPVSDITDDKRTAPVDPSKEDVEPSILPFSERLTIFSRLTKNDSMNAASNGDIIKSHNSNLEEKHIPKKLKFKTVGKLAIPLLFHDNNNNQSNSKNRNISNLGNKIQENIFTSSSSCKSKSSDALSSSSSSSSSVSCNSCSEKTMRSLDFVDKPKPGHNKKNISLNNTISPKIAKYFGIEKDQNQNHIISIQLNDNPDKNLKALETNGLDVKCTKKITDRSKKRRDLSKTVIEQTLDIDNILPEMRSRATTYTYGVPNMGSSNLIKKYEDLQVTKDELLTASKDFDRLFLETNKSLNSTRFLNQPIFDTDYKKGILKTKTGYTVGGLPNMIDQSSELKQRFERPSYTSAFNLKKSATLDFVPRTDGDQKRSIMDIHSDSDEDGVDPEKNLAKILRSVSKDNMQKLSTEGQQQPLLQIQHSDTLNLVRGLCNLEKGTGENEPEMFCGNSSTSEGESSGGREISIIIKNSASARRKKLNDG